MNYEEMSKQDRQDAYGRYYHLCECQDHRALTHEEEEYVRAVDWIIYNFGEGFAMGYE